MTASDTGDTFQPVQLPLWWTFGGLAAGLALGLAVAGSPWSGQVLAVSETIGTLWLRALQMTIIPLIAALLVTGIARMVETARAGAMARRTLGIIIAVLAFGAVVAAFAMPALLTAFPIPAAAGQALSATHAQAQKVPVLGDFALSLVAPNVITAAAQDAMLPVVVFFGVFAVAVARLPRREREVMRAFFHALGNAMLTIIGWVLWLAPLGVFALAIGVAARSGSGAIATLAHYIVLVASMGGVVLVLAYLLAWLVARHPLGKFARAVLPAQAVAISTQSSLASLPAMLVSCRTLGLRETSADFVLPLAVAIFRATSAAMNLAVAIYVARLTGVELGPAVIATGLAVALVTTFGSVSLPGSISFVSSIGPIAIAMGVPLGPLALLVAVEMLPDIMRTVGNVTMDVALTAMIDRYARED